MKVFKFFVAAAAACAMMVSCGTESGSISGKWIVNNVGGKTVSDCENTPYLTFDEKESSVNGCLGVNLLMGSYSYKDGALSFSNMGSTMMAGRPEDAEIERALNEALENTAKAKIDSDTLQLCDKAGTVLVTLTKAPSEEQVAVPSEEHNCTDCEQEEQCSHEGQEEQCEKCEQSEK